MNTFFRDDGTLLNYTLVNIKDWCKNSFVLCNELSNAKKHFVSKRYGRDGYILREEKGGTSFFHHVAALIELYQAAQEMLEENKAYFKRILDDFLSRYPFNRELFPVASVEESDEETV